MLTVEKLEELLQVMHFEKTGDVYTKIYPLFPCTMQVDLSSEKLIYPEKIRGRERNDGFDQAENFVVFECVDRLLEKGYRPEHIELEKQWHLGHAPKGGRADICISAPDGTMLAIIECKRYGKDFEKGFDETVTDGGQLFSYWQQERATKCMALYTSDLVDGSIVYRAPTFNCSDDPNIVSLAKKDKTLRLYSGATTAEEKFKVWKETYGGQIYEDLLFAETSAAYQIGIKPLYKRDLKEFSQDDKIVNRFEEILRHNNVSDKENAFNRLIALFICKLVDESTKGDDDIVDFQYKQGTDSYESLQDRLLRLHQEGMEKFMREKIMYVPDEYPEWLFANYIGQQRQKAIEDLKEKIRILKFYSNNDFSFQDVHNEELFYQNGKILVEVVRLFEKYRIVYPSKHQFLGDLFEQLLNKGFKQNEGQFFTPIPITRFIWDSLPIDAIMHTEGGLVYPKVIDYACGAGHFLTEAVEAIDFHAENRGGNDWARDCLFGIEKDYRLARVSKISLFMNGAGEGNIIFGDGLDNIPGKIEAGAFDILVANPPYSVAAFKRHLQLKNNHLDLLDSIGENGSEIEVLFIERIAQLLKPKGIAAVILPSSILTNDSASYTRARELLLQNFYLRAIVQLGSKTFGATGTNTVIVFLEKYNEPPKRADLVSDGIRAIFGGRDITEWEDGEIFGKYLTQIQVSQEQFVSFLEESASLEALCKIPYFQMYREGFFASADYQKLCGSKQFAKKTAEEQAEEIKRRFYTFAKRSEAEKMFYFAFTMRQKTLIIKSPADNAGQKKFLGYDWSNRKGNEGIQIISRGGELYNDADRNAEDTLASAVRAAFSGCVPVLSENNQKYARVVDTADMFDFERLNFNKAIRLDRSGLKIHSRYPIHRLGKKCDVRIGGTPSRLRPDYFTGTHLWVSIAEMQGQIIRDTKEKITDEAVSKSNVKLIPAGTTLLSFKLSIGKTAIAGTDLYTNEAIAALIPLDKNELLDKYLFYLFGSGAIPLEQSGNKAFGRSLNSAILRNEIYIPIPPMPIQQKVIESCEEVDREYASTRMTVGAYRNKIKAVLFGLGIVTEEVDGEEIG